MLTVASIASICHDLARAPGCDYGDTHAPRARSDAAHCEHDAHYDSICDLIISLDDDRAARKCSGIRSGK